MSDKSVFTNPPPVDSAPEPISFAADESSRAKQSAGASENAFPRELLRRRVVLRLIELVAESLGVDADEVDAGIALRYLGVDALTALRLVLSIERELGTSLQPTAFFDGSNIYQLADKVLLGKQ